MFTMRRSHATSVYWAEVDLDGAGPRHGSLMKLAPK